MQETEPAMYNVAVGETIDINVTPIGTGVFVAASLDGHTLSRLPGSDNAPHYRFVADGPVGTAHILGMEFSFPQANQGSRYDVSITGDHGGSAGLKIKESDPIKDPFLTFTVTN
jgi:hypothetical protein